MSQVCCKGQEAGITSSNSEGRLACCHSWREVALNARKGCVTTYTLMGAFSAGFLTHVRLSEGER